MARYEIAVAGDINWKERRVIEDLFASTKIDYNKIEVIHGGKRGAEKLAKEWAVERGVVCRNYAAYWGRYRYPSQLEPWQDMLEFGRPEEFWVLHNDIDSSKICKFMIKEALSLNISTYLIRGYDLDGLSKFAYDKLPVVDVKSIFTSPSYDLKILT